MTGRPKREGGARQVRVYRADDEEFAAIEKAATAAGKPVTEWVRETLLRAARRQHRSS